jgi:hypothetical protein
MITNVWVQCQKALFNLFWMISTNKPESNWKMTELYSFQEMKKLILKN